MEKLTNVIIDFNNSALSFIVESDIVTDLASFVVYMDECENVNNIYSDNNDDHNYVFDFENSSITVNGNEVIIENEVISELSKHLKYVRLHTTDEFNVEGLYYTPEIIYNNIILNIKKVCQPCLDNKTTQLITYVTFKRQLLDSAMELGLNKEAMQLYIDLCRMLEIDTCYKTCKQCSNCSSCAKCVNGCCTLK